jgi:hypothetical protein
MQWEKWFGVVLSVDGRIPVAHVPHFEVRGVFMFIMFDFEYGVTTHDMKTRRNR